MTDRYCLDLLHQTRRKLLGKTGKNTNNETIGNAPKMQVVQINIICSSFQAMLQRCKLLKWLLLLLQQSS